MKILSITLIFLFSICVKAQDFACASLFQPEKASIPLTEEQMQGLEILASSQLQTSKKPMGDLTRDMTFRNIRAQIDMLGEELKNIEFVENVYRNILSRIAGQARGDSQTLSEEKLRKNILVEQKKTQKKIIKIKNQYGAETLEMALIRATEKDDIDTVRFLLSVGADVNGRDSDRYTALHWATGRGKVEITKLLLENHASLDLRTKQDWTVLLMACFSHNPEVVQIILDHGSWGQINFAMSKNKYNGKAQDSPLDWAKTHDKIIFDLLTNYLRKVKSPRGRQRPAL